MEMVATLMETINETHFYNKKEHQQWTPVKLI